jgi:hypothetical protein
MAVNQKNESRGTVKFNSGVAYFLDKKGNKKSIESLQEAQNKEAECGCGVVCGCYSYIKLIDYNSETGAETPIVIYSVDGVLLVDTEANAKAEIDGYKAL